MLAWHVPNLIDITSVERWYQVHVDTEKLVLEYFFRDIDEIVSK